jgi:phosphatidylserine/phosphatidylglycerophosphate/cardiolipin synthase-like enzyme
VSDQIERLSSCLAEGFRESLRAQKTAGPSTLPHWAASLGELIQAILTARGSTGLAEALGEAIALTSDRVDQVSIAVTGPGWLGGGVPSVERILSELIAGAQQEIMLTAYSVTTGSDRIWAELERALATGIRVTVIVDRLQEQHADTRDLLKRLLHAYPAAFSLFDFAGEDTTTGLHAKVLVVDRNAALVGSANLSHRGMVTAHEMATIIRGPTADRMAGRVDALICSPHAVRVVRRNLG